MSGFRIVGLAGSRAGGKTRAVIERILSDLEALAPHSQTDLIALGELDVQFYDGRDINEYNADTQQVIRTIMACDVFVIGMPVFQGGMPGALKNVLDLLPRNALAGKTCAIIETGGTEKHMLVAEYQLKPVLNFLQAEVVPQVVFIPSDRFDLLDRLHDADTLVRLKTFADQILLRADLTARLNAKQDPWG